VSVDTQTTFVTFTATAGDKNITRIGAASEFPGEYQIFKNSVIQDTIYTGGGGGLNAIWQLENWELVATDVIDVKYEHGFNGKTPTVYGTIWGF
jgi:hypothetical protein